MQDQLIYADGSTISWEGVARLIELEGRIAKGVLFDQKSGEGAGGHYGDRCVVGVILDIQDDRSYGQLITKFMRWMMDISDQFEATPEERADYMAKWCRGRAIQREMEVAGVAEG